MLINHFAGGGSLCFTSVSMSRPLPNDVGFCHGSQLFPSGSTPSTGGLYVVNFQHPPNYPLRYPIYQLIETLQPLGQLRLGGLGYSYYPIGCRSLNLGHPRKQCSIYADR